MTQHHIPHVLLAAVDVETRTSLGRALFRSGYEVARCCGRWRMIDLIISARQTQDGGFDVFICDVRLLNETAVLVLDDLRQRQRLPPLVVVGQVHSGNAGLVTQLDPVAVVEDYFDTSIQLAWVREIAPLSGTASTGNTHQPQHTSTNV